MPEVCTYLSPAALQKAVMMDVEVLSVVKLLEAAASRWQTSAGETF